MSTLKLKKNIIILSLVQITNFAIPFITSLYLIKTIGPERFGLISFAIAYISYFMILTDFGFNLSAVRQVSLSRDNTKNLERLYSSVMILKSALILMSSLIFFGSLFLIDAFKKEYTLYIFTFSMILGQSLVPTWLFQGMEELKLISILGIATKVLSLILVYYLIKSPSDYTYVALINSIPTIALTFISMLIINYKHNIKIVPISIAELLVQFKYSSSYFLANLSSSIYTISITFILGITCSNESVGYFSAADKIIQGTKGFFYPVTQAIYPISAIKFNRNFNEGLLFNLKIGLPLLFVQLIIGACIATFSNEIILMLFGNNYIKSGIVLSYMAFLPSIILISNIFGVQILLNIKKQKIFRNILILSAIVSLIIGYPLISTFSEIGAAATIVLIEFLISSLMVFNAIKYTWKV